MKRFNLNHENLENIILAGLSLTVTAVGTLGAYLLSQEISHGVDVLTKYGSQALAGLPVALTIGPFLTIYGLKDCFSRQ